MLYLLLFRSIMLMMRLQRVGRKNDPSYRVVVTDKRTGPKSNKHVDLLGSYNPKLNHVQIDKDRAKDWIAKGVQPSDTVHNILVNEKVIDGKKVNPLPRKSPIIDEAKIKAEEEAKAAAEAKEAEVKAEAEAPAEEVAAEESVEESAPVVEEEVEEKPTA